MMDYGFISLYFAIFSDGFFYLFIFFFEWWVTGPLLTNPAIYILMRDSLKHSPITDGFWDAEKKYHSQPYFISNDY
jgi:hypothetical protein